MRPNIVDLHEDISLYYASEAAGLSFRVDDFGIDLPKKHADVPKYRKAGVKLVFGAIAPLVHTLDPASGMLLKSKYGYSIGALRIRGRRALARSPRNRTFHRILLD